MTIRSSSHNYHENNIHYEYHLSVYVMQTKFKDMLCMDCIMRSHKEKGNRLLIDFHCHLVAI